MKLEAKDLRIGNLVCIHSIKLQMCIEDFNFREDFFKPIPITEEWLLKLGFKYSDYYNNYRIMAGDYHNSVQLRDGKWLYNGDISDASCYGIREIKYVHTLQNLYHALNDEELTLNETR
jgi:hypothetical protein